MTIRSSPPFCSASGSPLISSAIATILGTIAGYVLARFGLFRGRTVLSGMVTAPLVMPEVITGLSMLLLFVQMQQLFDWPTRGSLTITVGAYHPSPCPTSPW